MSVQAGTTPHHSAEARARAVLERLPAGAVEGAEVGVYRGEMSVHLLEGRPDLVLHMVDSWLPAEAQPERYRRTRDPRARESAERQAEHMREAERATAFAAGRRRIIRAHSLAAAERFPDRSLDFVFIDAEHTYEAVLEDVAAWLPKIRPGGLLAGHDYVLAWADVVRAVDELVARHGWTLDLGEDGTWFVRLP